MERFYVIPPVNHMELSVYNGCKNHYCLAHLCFAECNPNWKQYRDFFERKRSIGDFVTLDNGAAESSLVTTDRLLELVKYINPNEVVAPDYLYDEGKTFVATATFIMALKNMNLQTDVMGVPQGDTPMKWLRSYFYMLDNPNIKVIGFSKLSIPKAFASVTDSNSVSVNRRYVVRLLNELGLLTKPIHLLGMRNVTEYKAYEGIKNIRSTDSCWSILAAINDIVLDANIVRDDVNETPDDYFFKKLKHEEIELAQVNIRGLKEILKC